MTTLEAFAAGDWTQTIQAETEQSHVGTLAHYRYQDVFTFGAEIVPWFTQWTGVTARHIGGRQWEIVDSGMHKARVHQLRVKTVYGFSISHDSVDDVFGVSVARYTRKDNRIVVTVDQPQPLKVNERPENYNLRKPSEWEPPTATVILAAGESLGADMRQALTLIRRVHATSDYRLIEDDGNYAFAAPLFK